MKMDFDFLNPKLLEDFKQVVSDYDDFLILKYGNVNGKNKLNCVFSAKDWIHVVVNGITSIDLNHKNQDVLSLNLVQFIVAIDLLTESIKQIHRVFNPDVKYSLENDKSIFKRSISDDIYFKHIRAAFGTHPINLISKDGIKSENRYFASWSSGGQDGEFRVYLYSNNPNEKDAKLTIEYNELKFYCQKRYEYLNILINTVISQAEQYKIDSSRNIIPQKNSPLEQLLILKYENKKRFGAYGYREQIDILIDLFSAPKNFDFNNKIVNNYLDKIRPCINEILDNLQSMNIIDLKIYPEPEYINIPSLSKFSYYIQKIYEHIVREDLWHQRAIIPSFIEELKENNLLPDFITIDTDKRDLRLILNAILFNAGAKITNENYEKKEVKNTVTIVDDIGDF